MIQLWWRSTVLDLNPGIATGAHRCRVGLIDERSPGNQGCSADEVGALLLAAAMPRFPQCFTVSGQPETQHTAWALPTLLHTEETPPPSSKNSYTHYNFRSQGIKIIACSHTAPRRLKLVKLPPPPTLFLPVSCQPPINAKCPKTNKKIWWNNCSNVTQKLQIHSDI